MGSEFTTTETRGLLLHDQRLTAVESATSEASPQPGVPELVSTQKTFLALEASGEQAAGVDLRVQCLDGGFAEPGGAKFCWKGNSDTDWRGWDAPNTLQGFESLVWGNDTANPYQADECSVIALDNHKVIAAYRKKISTTNSGVYTQVFDPSTNAWTEATVRTTITPTDPLHPGMVQLPSGRVLLFNWIKQNSGAHWNIEAWFSDDDGVTWSTYSTGTLAIEDVVLATGYTPGRLRAAYKDGQIVIVGELNPSTLSRLVQFASTDLGHTFDRVSVGDTTARYVDLLVYNSEFRLFCMLVADQPADARPAMIPFGDAYQDVTDASTSSYELAETVGPGTQSWAAISQDLNVISDGELSAWVDDTNAIHLCLRKRPQDDPVIWVSTDGGDTWTAIGGASSAAGGVHAPWFRSQGQAYPTGFDGVSASGRVVMVTNFDGNTNAYGDNSLFACHLGGYSTKVVPLSFEGADPLLSRVPWEKTYIPIDTPDNCGWTQGGGTAGAIMNTAPPRLRINTTADTGYYTIASSTTKSEGFKPVQFALECASGGSVSSPACAVRFDVNDGSDDYSVDIRFSTTAFRVYDVATSAQVGDDVSIDMTDAKEFMVAIAEDRIAVWYRDWADDFVDREWTLGVADAIGTGAAHSQTQVWFGSIASSTCDQRWYKFCFCDDGYVGYFDLPSGQTNPDDLQGRAYSVIPQWVDGGTFMRARGGPAVPGDIHKIATRYGYPREAILPTVSASPRRAWRSTSLSNQSLVFDFTGGIGSDVYQMSGSFGIGMFGINWRTATVEVYSGSYSTLYTIDAADGLTSLAYERSGNTIRPSSSATGSRYLHRDELVGGTIKMGSTYRKILGNAPGYWGNVRQKAVIYFDGYTDTEPASGSSLEIWCPQVTSIYHLADTQFEKVRITITSSSAADSYFTIGSMVAGPYVAFGKEYSFGRTEDETSNTNIRTSDDGYRTARNLGPNRRIVTFGWTEGVDTTLVYAQDDDYILGTSTANAWAIAGRSDTPFDVLGLASHLRGGLRPVVYLADVDKGTPDTLMITDKRLQLYGRIIGDVGITSALGGEGSSEVFTINTIVIEEEV